MTTTLKSELALFSRLNHEAALKEDRLGPQSLELLRALLGPEISDQLGDQLKEAFFRVEELSDFRQRNGTVEVVFCRQQAASNKTFLPKQRIVLEVGEYRTGTKARWYVLTAWDQRDGGRTRRSSVKIRHVHQLSHRLAGHIAWLLRQCEKPLGPYWEQQVRIQQKSRS